MHSRIASFPLQLNDRSNPFVSLASSFMNQCRTDGRGEGKMIILFVILKYLSDGQEGNE
jgi:hypothetical protein